MSLKKFIIPIFLLLGDLTAGSQTIYEIKYHFELEQGKENYQAFIIRNADGTGFIRSAFTDLKTNTRNITETLMEEKFGVDDQGHEDTTLLIFIGYDPIQIAGTVLYKPDHFVFQLSEDGFYEPAFVMSSDETDEQPDMGVIDDVALLNQEDMTREKVLTYFTEQDEFYQNLFETTVRSLSAEEKKTQLHLVLVANTNDLTIGKTCAVDKETTYKTFSEIAEFLGIGFNSAVISGDDFSKANVEKAINNLRPGANDIVVFYYSGHGFSNLQDNYTFPYLDLRDKRSQPYGGAFTLNMEAVYQKIKSKGARLNLVLSDCCNNDPSQTNNITSEAPSTRTSSLGWDKNKCLALFMNPGRTSLLMTAAQKGELSAGNVHDGGFFTFNFRESMEKSMALYDKSKDVSWNTVAAGAKTQTITRANRTLCRQVDESLKKCVQNPVFRLD